MSPDGKRIAAGVFGNQGQIWLHTFDPFETGPLAGTEGGDSPFWSPDGSALAFFRQLELLKIDPATGTIVRIAAIPRVSSGGTWHPNGTILFGAENRIFRVSASGGSPVVVPLSGVRGVPVASRFLPDGRHFVFSGWIGNGGHAYVGSLDSDRVTELMPISGGLTFASPDQLLFLRGASIFAQTIDPATFALVGDPRAIASGVSPGSLHGREQFRISTSADGVLAYVSPRGGSTGHLAWLDRDGRSRGAIESPGDVEFLNPAISPDGTLVAANRLDPQTGEWDIWLIDVVRQIPIKLTTDPASEFDPVWSPDGKEIVYTSTRNGELAFYRERTVQGGTPERLLSLKDARMRVATDWSRDGRFIVYQRAGVRPWAIWALPLSGDRTPIQLVDDRFSAYAGQVSPDTQWLAYNSFQSGRSELFVRRFLAESQPTQISNGGGVHPRWTRGGKELMFWASPQGIFAHDVSFPGGVPSVGPRRAVVNRPVLSLIDGRTHYDVTLDGERLLVRQPAGPQGPGIKVILNWTSRLRGPQ